MSKAGGRFLAVQRGVYDTAPDQQRGLDVAARLRESHRMATIRPVRVTLARDQAQEQPSLADRP
jgi:hypothetical protein